MVNDINNQLLKLNNDGVIDLYIENRTTNFGCPLLIKFRFRIVLFCSMMFLGLCRKMRIL